MKKITIFVVASLAVSLNSLCTLQEKDIRVRADLKPHVKSIGSKECRLILLGCTLCAKGAICCMIRNNYCLGLSCCAFGLVSYLDSQSDANKTKQNNAMSRD